MVAAGDYRFFVTIEQPVRRENVLGELELAKDTGWEQVAQVWASITPLTAKEINYARQVQLQTTHRVKCRYFPELESSHRITWVEASGRKRTLGISGITDVDERHVEWAIEAVEQRRG